MALPSSTRVRLWLVIPAVLALSPLDYSAASLCGQQSNAPASVQVATPGEVPAELFDPAFANTIDLANVRRAIGELNATALINDAMQLIQAERELKRKHKGCDSSALLDLTIRAIGEQHDAQALAELQKELSRLSIKDFDAKVEALSRLIDRPRRISAGPNVPRSETTAEAIVLYNTLMQQVKVAKVVGDRTALGSMRKSVQELKELHPKQRQHLLVLVDESIASLPAELPLEALALAKLSAPLYER